LAERPRQVVAKVDLQADSVELAVLQAAAVGPLDVQAAEVVLHRPQQIQFCLLVSVTLSCSRATQWAMAHFGNQR
jgi:hypothetical protein